MPAPMHARTGSSLRTELIVQLGVVVGLALVVLIATLAWSYERALQEVVGRALVAEARGGENVGARVDPGADWWNVARDGTARPRGPVSAPLDWRTHDLAARARDADGAVVDAGAPWAPIRFAIPVDAIGGVAVARLPVGFSLALRAKPLAVVTLLVAMTLALFAGVGAVLLDTRVVGPLERLADAARQLSDGDGGVAVAVEGPTEAADLARAFNEMRAALEVRNKSLVDAIADLRAANAELAHTQAGLARAERLAVVGRLAAGVAHEVGNPLGAMLAFGELAAQDPGISHAGRTHLSKAAAAGERARRILAQLLDYARSSRPQRVAFALCDVVRDAADLLRAQCAARGVALELTLEAGLHPAIGDPHAATQIVLNLLLNAMHACAEGPVRHVRVRVCAAPLRVRAGDSGRGVARAFFDAVVCSVADTGHGVREEDRQRIFDPFFTTKAPGEGTGLGLATALRMAHELGGELELSESAPHGFATELVLRLEAQPERGRDTTRAR